MRLRAAWIAVALGSLLAWSPPARCATVEVSGSTALTDNSEYDRNPSIVNDGSDYWLFWTKGDDTSTAGVRGSYDPDGDTYVVYYKTEATIQGLASASETKLDLSESARPAGFDQRVVSATVFGGDIYAFVSSGQSGTTRGLHYYKYDGSWSGPTTLIADATARGGHVNVTTDADRVYIVWESVDGSSDCYTWDGATSSKIDISTDNQPKITRMGTTLYVVSIEDGSGDIEVYSAAAAASPSFSSHSTAISGVGLYNPVIFNDSTDLYVVTAPYDGGDDQQWLIQTKDELADGTWAADKSISLGGYQDKSTATWTYWWEYWPIGYHDGNDAYVFFTTETASPTFSDGEIHVVKMDWDLANDHYLYVQNGIDEATATDTVNVAAGTYVENLTVDKALTLAGAGQGNTILLPAVSSPGCATPSSLCGGAGYGSSSLILVSADDVTVHDMTLDGDNPALTSGEVFGSADIDARNGIIENYHLGSPFNNLEVYNVTVQNIFLRGIYASTGGNSIHIHDNIIDNVQAEATGNSLGIMIWNGAGIVEDNTVSNCTSGIGDNWTRGVQYLSNTVTDSDSGIHTDNAGCWDPYGLGIGANLLQGNNVSACGFGIFTFAVCVAPTVRENTVTDCDVGLNPAGGGSAGQLYIGNTVDGGSDPNSVGVYVTTSIYGYGTEDVSATFTENTVINTGQGFRLQERVCTTNVTTGCNVDSDCPDYPSETCDASSTLTLSANCNLIGDSDVAVLTETLASPANAVFFDSIIAGNSVGVDATAITSGLLDAKDNYWGCPTGPDSPGCDTKLGNVEVTPFATTEPACVPCAGAGGDADGDDVCTDFDNCPTDANPGQKDIDDDGLGDVCDPEDVAGLSVRKVLVWDPTVITQLGGWRALGELDTTTAVDFPADILADGVTAIVWKQAGGGSVAPIHSQSFTAAQCSEQASRITCKDPATRSTLRMRKRWAIDFYRVVITIREQGLELPDLTETPLMVGIQSADLIDRADEINSCAARKRRTVCRERP